MSQKCNVVEYSSLSRSSFKCNGKPPVRETDVSLASCVLGSQLWPLGVWAAGPRSVRQPGTQVKGRVAGSAHRPWDAFVLKQSHAFGGTGKSDGVVKVTAI